MRSGEIVRDKNGRFIRRKPKEDEPQVIREEAWKQPEPSNPVVEDEEATTTFRDSRYAEFAFDMLILILLFAIVYFVIRVLHG